MTGRLLARLVAAGTLALSLAWSHPASASGYLDEWHPYQTYWAVGWSAAVPLAAYRSGFISNTGWLGGGFDARVGVAGPIAVGMSGTWNYFEQTFSSLQLEQGNVTFTGPVFRRTSTFTALATVHWYLTRSNVQPFVGAGMGGMWANTNQQIVNLPEGSVTSGLAIAGEAGVLFTVAERLGLYLSGRYQVSLTTIQGIANPQWVSGQAGVAYYY